MYVGGKDTSCWAGGKRHLPAPPVSTCPELPARPCAPRLPTAERCTATPTALHRTSKHQVGPCHPAKVGWVAEDVSVPHVKVEVGARAAAQRTHLGPGHALGLTCIHTGRRCGWWVGLGRMGRWRRGRGPTLIQCGLGGQVLSANALLRATKQAAAGSRLKGSAARRLCWASMGACLWCQRRRRCWSPRQRAQHGRALLQGGARWPTAAARWCPRGAGWPAGWGGARSRGGWGARRQAARHRLVDSPHTDIVMAQQLQPASAEAAAGAHPHLAALGCWDHKRLRRPRLHRLSIKRQHLATQQERLLHSMVHKIVQNTFCLQSHIAT